MHYSFFKDPLSVGMEYNPLSFAKGHFQVMDEKTPHIIGSFYLKCNTC